MHGLVNKAVECFVRDTHGAAIWRDIASKVEPGLERFEPMLLYADDMTDRCLSHLAAHLDMPVEAILEDLGTYLVFSRTTEALRRLLRFGGVTYSDFLMSLDDLPDRVRLAVPDLVLPEISVEQESEQIYKIRVGTGMVSFGYVLVGVLRALADDYGTLVMLEHEGTDDAGGNRISIEVHEIDFSSGRAFDLTDRRATG